MAAPLRPLDPAFEISGRRVWVAGHRGMVGAAVVRRLASEDCALLQVESGTLDLRRQADTEAWMAAHRPEVVVVAAARVGGIHANDTRPAEFIYDNLAIETNVIHAAWRTGVAKLLFLGSTCVYPREAVQPMREEALLSGSLEPTNQWYAVAKIAGIKLCEAYRKQYGCDFISAQPTNLYGAHDRFDLEAGHVLPALMRRLDEARRAAAPSVEVWGTGRPRREFLYVDDLADALVFLLRHYSRPEPINIGSGAEVTIRELAETVAQVVGYQGKLAFNPEMPDGTPRKLADASRLAALGWTAPTALRTGIERTFRWYLDNVVGSEEGAA